MREMRRFKAIRVAIHALFGMTLVIGLNAKVIVELELLPDSPFANYQGWPNDISADGSVIVGISDFGTGGTQYEGFVWKEGVMSKLSPFYEVTGVSDDGSILVGYTDTEAVRYENGVLTGLGFLPECDLSGAELISGNGKVITGYSRPREASSRDNLYFRWENGVMAPIEGNRQPFTLSYDGSIMLAHEGEIVSIFKDGNWSELEALPGHRAAIRSMSSDGSIIVGRCRDIENPMVAVPCVWIGEDPLALEFFPETEWGEALSVSADGTIIFGECHDLVNPRTFGFWYKDENWAPVSLNSILAESATGVESDYLDLHASSALVRGNQLSEDGTTIIGRIEETHEPSLLRIFENLALFGPYEIGQDSYCNTTGFMGMLYVEHDPWVWSVDMDHWLYCPGENVTTSGGWVFMPK